MKQHNGGVMDNVTNYNIDGVTFKCRTKVEDGQLFVLVQDIHSNGSNLCRLRGKLKDIYRGAIFCWYNKRRKTPIYVREVPYD